MDKTIKELTLLLIYLTSWQEDAGLTKVQRSWKGYSFEIRRRVKQGKRAHEKIYWKGRINAQHRLTADIRCAVMICDRGRL